VAKLRGQVRSASSEDGTVSQFVTERRVVLSINLFRISFLFILTVMCLGIFAPLVAAGQSRIKGDVDDTARVPIAHSRLGLTGARDMGPVDESARFERMTLVLKMSSEQQRGLAALLDSQQTKGSASYHRWLTPEEFGRQFGPAPEDLAKIQNWLAQEGFQVGTVAKSGLRIEFSGTVGQVNAAFRTEMRRYTVGGEMHIANVSDISIPAALASVVEGVPLHDFFSKPLLVHGHAQDAPFITASWNGAHAMTPGDFATIYDLLPLYKSSMNGSGQTIAIVAEADVAASDVAAFQSIFGLPANLPTMVENGQDPGFDVFLGYGAEATIDAEWAAAVAPGATIDMVVTGPQYASDPAELSAASIVDQNLAQIVSISYGNCEANLGTAQSALWNQVWEQGAAEGMSIFAASGDAGAAGCAGPGAVYNNVGNVATVNGVASSPYVTAVGGTEFDETVNGASVATFWNSTNAANLSSATGYIPEMVWNDSCPGSLWCPAEPYTSFFSAGGGGVSSIYATPPWQTLGVTGLNVLANYTLPGQTGLSPRGVPDVSLDSSADHDGYLFCFTTTATSPDCQVSGGVVTQNSFQNEAGGTSFAAPAFAGIMSVVNEKVKSAGVSANASVDGRQGLANYVLYSLAATEQYTGCNSSDEAVPTTPTPTGCSFHDITVGNNSVPGVPAVKGYDATAGYDLASGLGSVDAANLAANWVSAEAGFQGTQTTLATSPAASSITVAHGQSVTLTASVEKLAGDTSTATPAGNISLIAEGGTLPTSLGVITAVPLEGSGGSAATGNFNIQDLPGGSYSLVARFPGDGTFAGSDSNPVAVNITPEVSTTTLNVGVSSWPYGRDFGFNATVTGATGQGIPTGVITFSDNGKILGKVPLSNLDIAYFSWCGPPDAAQVFPNIPPIACPSVGTHVFTATYSGDTSFTASPTPMAATQSWTVQITPGTAPGGINVTPTQSDPNYTLTEPLTFTAVVESSPNGVLPTGTVQFFKGTTQLSQPIAVTGNPAEAAVSNIVLPQGMDLITAKYSGDGNYAATSYQINWNWGVPIGWTATTTVATVNPGDTATYNLSLSASGFSGTAAISCVPSMSLFKPTQTVVGASCSVSPTTVTLTSGGSAIPVVVTITTTMESKLNPPQFRGLPFTLPPVLALVFFGARKRRWSRLLGCIVAVLAISLMTSCGGGGRTITQTGPPATSGIFSVWAGVPASSTETVYSGAKLTLNVNQ
jgi:hypothetical protein